MSNKSDIQDLDDIKLLVDDFYKQVQVEPLLGPIFDEVIKDQWPVHLSKMYRFWQTLLLGERTYDGAPFPPHMALPIDGEHFDKWIEIFHSTVDKHFKGEKADEAKWRSTKMAALFTHKLAFHKNAPFRPLI